MSGYQLFPNLTIDEAEALAADIKERGVLVPVELDEDGAILDGHHRVMIADSLGIEYPTVVRSGMTEAEKLEHVFALNIARRHLSGTDRSAVISLCRQRGMSLRAIAKTIGVSDRTVRRDVDAANAAPVDPEGEPEPEPLPTAQTRAERARELEATGMTKAAIAAEMELDPSTVQRLLKPRASQRSPGADIPADWPHAKAFMAEIKALPDKAPEPRLFAQAVPVRNRASVARTLRDVGTLLGTIARELERSER